MESKQTGKKINKQGLWDLWDYNMRSKILTIETSEGKGKQSEADMYSKKYWLKWPKFGKRPKPTYLRI